MGVWDGRVPRSKTDIGGGGQVKSCGCQLHRKVLTRPKQGGPEAGDAELTTAKRGISFDLQAANKAVDCESWGKSGAKTKHT